MCAWLPSFLRKRPEPSGVVIEIMWGGYYASREVENGPFGVFRLLDFNQYAYHAALFQETFPTIPSLAEVTALAPAIGHVPLDSLRLLDAPIHLLGWVPLKPADLEGYMIFMQHHGAPDETRAELESAVIGFSQAAPIRVRLMAVGEQLQVTQLP